MNSCAFIIFGVSGDLAKRKLIPALYTLIAKKKIDNFVILGAAHADTTVQALLEQAKPFINNVDNAVWQMLGERMIYQQVDFNNEADFVALHTTLGDVEKKYSLSGNRLVYMACASHFFCMVTEHVARAGIASRSRKAENEWHRIVYEKPFGHDAGSAQTINDCIARFFDELQIYRIDHYLTKELVGNIALVRFTNCVFEPLWNNRYIDNVQIILSETVGVQDRGSYYDHYGALKDMVQNHMLELVALVGMESPQMLTGEHIRERRAKVLEKVRVVDALVGQYEGYTQEPGVAPDSKTDTFALVSLMIDNLRWAGVPFYLKTGKCLNKKETVIHIKFKQVDCLLTKNCPSDSNYLTIEIAPEGTFSLSLNVKKPGESNQVVPVKMEFCHSCLFSESTPESYEVIFEDVMRGEHSIAVRFDEIEYAWKAIDKISAQQLPLYTYKKGSQGPVQIEDFAKKHGLRWRS